MHAIDYGRPWKSPTTPLQWAAMAIVLGVFVAVPVWDRWNATGGQYAHDLAMRMLYVMSHMSLLATWVALRPRPKVWGFAGPVVALLVYLVFATFFLIGESILRFRVYDWALLAMIPLTFSLTTCNLVALRRLWWVPSVAVVDSRERCRTFSLGRMMVWTAAVALLLALLRATAWVGRQAQWPLDLQFAIVASVFASLYCPLAVAWIAPRGWLAKLATLPLVAGAVVGLIVLETLMFPRSGGWGGVVIAILIQVNLLHAATIAAALLLFRMASLFVVDSVLGGERLDERFLQWMRRRPPDAGKP